MVNKLIKYLWIGTLSGLLLLVLHILAVSINFLGLYGPMPSFDMLENPESELASELYSSDGLMLGKYFRSNRSNVDYNDISKNMINALVATEDSRFEDHSGVDFKALMRVISGVVTGNQKGGGSTLSQQLAKNLFNMRQGAFDGPLYNVPKVEALIVKTKEWITAIRLERSYTKEEIMTMYLNTVDFGSNALGLKTAAKTFFSTTPDKLKIQEAAILVGVLKAPTTYSPIINPDAALNRRNTVLSQMEKYDYLTREEEDSLAKMPIKLKYEVENQNKGMATYFRTVAHNYLTSWCKKRGIDLYSSGLKIYTTINSKAQVYAEAAVEKHMKYIQKEFDTFWKGRNPWIDENGKELPDFINQAIKRTDRYKSLKNRFGDNQDSINYHLNKKIKMRVFSWKGEKDTIMSPIDSLKYYKKFLQAGLIAINPATGHIVAWVGGVDHKYFKFDHVKQSKRQPGSTFKPFVYLSAIDNGYSPCFEIQDVPVTFQFSNGDNSATWTPQNSEGEFTGRSFSLRQAMARSINSITANVMKRMGPNTVVDYCRRLGFTSPLEAVPALCLGSSDVSIYELVGAYATFPNKGIYNEPQFILRIEDKNGKILEDFAPITKEALNEETAFLMCHMLKGGTEERGGTALGLHRYPAIFKGNEVGGKTGTTSNYSDGWFMGVTQNLVAGVWVGGDDRCIHFTNYTYGQGSKLALPIVGMFMEKVYADTTVGIKAGYFKRPSKKLSVQIDCKKYSQNEQPLDSTNSILPQNQNTDF